MKGKHHLIVQNEHLKYEFDIKRNLTILAGDSATGKTTLIEMIQEYLIEGEDSGVSLYCDVECRVLTGNLWKEQLEATNHSIVFVDEGNRFVRTQKFAETIQKTDNYYVIVSREILEMLPVSVNEIYGIRSSGKYGGLVPVYHELYKIYNLNLQENYPVHPQTIIVEDSNSGYEFFNAVANEHDLCCLSAGGKSNIFTMISDTNIYDALLVIADGAAFGSQMNRIERFIKGRPKLALYLPESFEWLLLSAGFFQNTELTNILENPEDYIESKEFFSWEQFFTTYLINISRDHYLQYSKRKLNPNYLNANIKNRIIKMMNGINFEN